MVGILLASFTLWISQIDDPFVGRHENNSAYMTIAGMNYIKYGYFEYNLAPIMHTDPLVTSPTNFYWNHPPLGGLLASFSLLLFGVPEVSSRLIPIFLTMLGMSAFTRWVKRTWGRGIAIGALAIFAASPVIAYYGQMLNHEPLILAFALMILPIVDDRHRNPKQTQLLWVGILIALMVLSGWQALFFSAIYAVYATWQRDWQLVVLLTVSTIGAVLAWTLPLALRFPTFIDHLYNQFLYRSGITESAWSNQLDYLWQIIWARWRPRYTEAAALMTVGGILVALTPAYRKPFSRLILSALLIVPAILQVVVFQQQTFSHDYTVYYFAPAVAVFSALCLHAIWQNSQTSKGIRPWMMRGIGLLLILAFALSSLRWTYTIYAAEDRFPVELAPIVREETAPGDIIYTNNLGWITATWYYSQRDFRPIQNAPEQGYIALTCLPEPTNEPDTFRAGNLHCVLEAR